MATRESSLDFSDSSSEHIVTVFSNNIRTFLEAIQLYQLFVLVNHECDEMCSNFILSGGNCTLTLVGISFMGLLEILSGL